MQKDRKAQMRRKSMWGAALFVLGVIVVIVSVPMRSVGLATVGVVLLLPGAVMLWQVGKALP
jgi:membrane-bound ClpP family serine protease